MAERVPLWLPDPTAHPVADTRLAQGGLLVSSGTLLTRSGVFPGPAALAVSAPGGLVARVAPGRCVVQGTEATAGGLQGPYLCVNDANRDLAIAPTAAGQLRVDLIVARIYDDDYSGATRVWALEVVQGVAAPAAPAEPAVPVSSLVLGRVDVPAGAGAIAAGNLTDRRKWAVAAGGTLPLATDAERVALAAYEGLRVAVAATGAEWVYLAGSWRQLYGDLLGWTNLPLAAAYSATTAPNAPQVRVRANGTVYFRGYVKRNAGDFAASTDYTIVAAGGVPALARPTSQADATLMVAGSNPVGPVKAWVDDLGALTLSLSAGSQVYVTLAGLSGYLSALA